MGFLSSFLLMLREFFPCSRPRRKIVIIHKPEGLECQVCGRVKLVHQNKERNIGNGLSNTNEFVSKDTIEYEF
jgi:hypothetical protein